MVERSEANIQIPSCEWALVTSDMREDASRALNKMLLDEDYTVADYLYHRYMDSALEDALRIQNPKSRNMLVGVFANTLKDMIDSRKLPAYCEGFLIKQCIPTCFAGEFSSKREDGVNQEYIGFYKPQGATYAGDRKSNDYKTGFSLLLHNVNDRLVSAGEAPLPKPQTY